MERIRNRTGAVDSLDIAVLAALNIANHLLSLQGEDGVGGVSRGERLDGERLRDLVERVEALARSSH